MIERHKIFIDGILTEVDELPEIPPVIRRMQEYNIGHQLNLLVDDIQAGLFGEAAKSGKFIEYVMDIKEKHPKR